MEKIIYHITEKDYFEDQMLNGQYISQTFEAEGFIHLSTKNQVEPTLQRYYSGKAGLVLLQIDAEKMKGLLKYEIASNGEYFPHIYGPITKEAIMIVEEIDN
jgi:uncharacterized protein (DUF952 family)